MKTETEITETKSSITSGDWKCHNAFARYEIRPDGARKNVAEVYEESDAHIIAASKDMYEALKYARRFLNEKDVDMKFIDATLTKAEGK